MRRVSLSVVVLVVLLGGGWMSSAPAADSWREDFDRICARTGEAGKMDEAELNRLISESDRLRERIAGSNDPDSKVYLFRIGKCRDFFLFMRDAAANAQRP